MIILWIYQNSIIPRTKTSIYATYHEPLKRKWLPGASQKYTVKNPQKHGGLMTSCQRFLAIRNEPFPFCWRNLFGRVTG